MKVPIVTIPTYWTREKGKKKINDTYFDHPTAVDGLETLTRTLESFKNVDGKFKIIILTSITDYNDDRLYKKVVKKVSSIIKPFSKDFPIMQFSKNDVKIFHESMKKNGLQHLIPQINLANYPAIRNFQIILVNGLGSDIMIGIDDDEVVMPDHVKKATEFIGKRYKGKFVYGIGGYYRDRNGEYIMKNLKKPDVDNLFYKKRILKNQGFINMDKKKGRVNKSDFVFGGNMVIHRKMFMNVAYDLGITRGENIDYLINAKMMGFDIYFDKDLYIIHMPPEKWDIKIKSFLKTGAFSMTNYLKLEVDVQRFIYEKEKINECNEKFCKTKNININSIKPYPGDFFSDKLEKDAIYALKHMYPDEAKRSKVSAETFVRNTLERARKLAPNYFSFNENWKKLMKCVAKDSNIQKYLNRKWF